MCLLRGWRIGGEIVYFEPLMKLKNPKRYEDTKIIINEIIIPAIAYPFPSSFLTKVIILKINPKIKQINGIRNKKTKFILSIIDTIKKTNTKDINPIKLILNPLSISLPIISSF